jgi:uncharacterized protein
MPVSDGSYKQSSEFDGRVLDAQKLEQLACPVCFGALRLDAPDPQILCIGCKRRYPLIDGIPVLIPERAIAPDAPGRNEPS